MDNAMIHIAEGYQSEWTSRAELQEKHRRDNLFGVKINKKEQQEFKELVPLRKHFEKLSENGKGAGSSLEKISNILAPHETYKSSLNELLLLFQNVDVAGEKRRALMKEKAEKEEAEREMKRKIDGGSEIERKMEERKKSERTKVKRLKWWQKIDDTGNLDLEDSPTKENANHPLDSTPNCKRTKTHRPALNHRSFHYVLTLTRQNKSHYRNLRQQTHTLKRVVLSELTLKIYSDQRLWFHRWNDQERLLGAALETFVEEANNRKKKEDEDRKIEEKKKRVVDPIKSKEEIKKEKRETRLKRRETRRKIEEKEEEGKSIPVTPAVEERRKHVFEELSAALTTALPVKKSYHDMNFFHNLMKYHRSSAFSRPKWVTWCAYRNKLRDLEARAEELEVEKNKIEGVETCPMKFKHGVKDHCKTCGRRIIKNIEMWLTNVTEPKTRVESFLHMDHVLSYCKSQTVVNAGERLNMEREIYDLEIHLFGQCAGYLQRKYAVHRGYVNVRTREEKVNFSEDDYKDRRFEFMAEEVRNGQSDTAMLYVKYADIEDKLEAYFHYNAKLRRRRLRMAGKRIIRIYRQRKITKQLEAKLEEEEKNKEMREHMKMVEEERARVAAAAEKKTVEDMRAEVKKRLDKHEKDNTFVCPRRECCRKTFHSKELYQMHERIHINQDIKENAIKAKKKVEAEARLEREKAFLKDVHAKREERKKQQEEEKKEAERLELAENLANLELTLDDDMSINSNLSDASLGENGNDDPTDPANHQSSSASDNNSPGIDLEEFYRVTSPSHYAQHIQHFEQRPTSPSVPKLFLDFQGGAASLGAPPMSLSEMLREENERLRLAQAEEMVSSFSLNSSSNPNSKSRLPSVGPMYNDDISLTSSITDDFDFRSEQDFRSARSSVTGVDLEDAIAELEAAKRDIHDNFSSPRFVLVSTHVMPSEDLPQEFFLNKSLIRAGRSDKCDLTFQPMVNAHMIGKVHMLIYTTWNEDGSIDVFVRDNKTKFGTYMLNESGVKKCPGLTALVDNSVHMQHGDKLLICRDFAEAAPYEIIYQLKMPNSGVGNRKNARGLGGGKRNISNNINVTGHLKEIPKLIESGSFWWDEGKEEGAGEGGDERSEGSSARNRIASRVARLRKAANGEKPSRRGTANGIGGSGSGAVSLPSLRGARKIGGLESEENSFDESTLASISDSETYDSYGDLGSIGSLNSSSVNTIVTAGGSVKSAPVKKSRFMTSGGGGSVGGSSGGGDGYSKKRQIKDKYSKLTRARNRFQANNFLTVVDGKVVIER
ncbi:hypothetical protein TrLO_g4809 [Triparma laevis f. longispina]|uniref:C2H2-type domain-containing protein n=1 Tax=Triparma laevis f. longispina TaxID=1714387 RepID=A0A9W7KWZ6_9STRA|nr:hypothetical protein TrLO_g4809 [Triparma laevis f. longispina]